MHSKSSLVNAETDLEDFLVRKAIPYERTNYGKTYLVIDSEKLEQRNF